MLDWKQALAIGLVSFTFGLVLGSFVVGYIIKALVTC